LYIESKQAGKQIMKSDHAKQMTFTMGLPGAGKSRVIANDYATITRIDPDLVKAAHPDYNPKDPGALHAWSAAIAEEQFQVALGTDCDYVIDGTGTNSDKMVRRIRQAHAAGFTCTLVYVRVSVETAIARNAARARSVDVAIIREKALDIETAFSIVSAEADEAVIVNND